MQEMTRTFLLSFLLTVSFLPSLTAEPKTTIKPLQGHLYIVGGGTVTHDMITEFLSYGGGEHAKLVIITTASLQAGSMSIEPKLSIFRDQFFGSLNQLHTRNRDESNDPKFSEILEDATAVWFIGGNQNWLTDAYLGTLIERRVHNVLQKGGVVGGTSAGAAIMSRVMIAGGKTEPVVAEGFGFLPNTIVDQHFLKRNRLGRLQLALKENPALVGFGIDEGTAMIVTGRKVKVTGESSVTVCMPELPDSEGIHFTIKAGEQSDFIALQRRAITRSTPLTKVTTPGTRKGTLILVSQGQSQETVTRAFMEKAGAENSIVVLDAENMEPGKSQLVNQLKKAGAKKVAHVYTHTLTNNSAANKLLQEAQGVWIEGQEEVALLEMIDDRPVQRLFQDVLQRGGVVCGAAAGAKIQGQILTAEIPQVPQITTDCYERGMGLLPGMIIECKEGSTESDELVELCKKHPFLTGMELEEKTAVMVEGHTMQVIGEQAVALYESAQDTTPKQTILRHGQRYNLKDRCLIPANKTILQD